MRLRAFALAGLAAATLAVPGHSETPGERAWVHVRVEEHGRGSKVSVNMPLSVVDAALQAAPDKVISNGHIRLGHFGDDDRDLSVSDLRKAWSELKATGDAEFVTVEEENEKVRIAREGNLVLVHVEKPSGREAVRVEVPIEVVDALLSGQGQELNVRAALVELQKRRGDVVRVHDDDSTVRIWIDEGK